MIETTQAQYMDYADIKLNPSESYKMFWDRLLNFKRQFLAPAGVTVQHVTSPVAGDRMSISLMNFVTLDWLSRLHVKLPKVIQVEFAARLREEQLAELVHPIAKCLDSLALKHGFSIRQPPASVLRVESTSYQYEEDPSQIAFTQFNPRGSSFQGRRGTRGRGWQPRGDASSRATPRGRGQGFSCGRGAPAKDGFGQGPWCTDCYTKSQTQKRPIHFRHLPSECPALQVGIKQVQQNVDNYQQEEVQHSQELPYDPYSPPLYVEEEDGYSYGNVYRPPSLYSHYPLQATTVKPNYGEPMNEEDGCLKEDCNYELPDFINRNSDFLKFRSL